MVVMVVAIVLFGRLAQAPRMAGAIGSCMHTASSGQRYQGLGHVRKGQSQPCMCSDLLTLDKPLDHFQVRRYPPAAATILVASVASVNSVACWLHCPLLGGCTGRGQQGPKLKHRVGRTMFCIVSGGTTEPTRVRPKRPWMVGRGVATRQEGWGLARCYCWLQVTRRRMDVLCGFFDAVSCVGDAIRQVH